MLASSKEYLYVPLTSDQDITEADVFMSVVPGDAPVSWQPAEHTEGGIRALIGGDSDMPLVQGLYHRVLVRVSGNPEDTILYAGSIFAG